MSLFCKTQVCLTADCIFPDKVKRHNIYEGIMSCFSGIRMSNTTGSLKDV